MENSLKTPTVVIGREVSVLDLNASGQPWVGQLVMHAHILGGHSRDVPVDLSNISLSCCNQAAKAHRDHWNTRTGLSKITFDLLQDTCGPGAKRIQQWELRLIMKSKDKINNITADIFAGRTSQPTYIDEKGVYLPAREGDNRIFSEAKSSLFKHGLVQGSHKEGVVDSIHRTGSYISSGTAINLLATMMVFPSYEAAIDTFNHVWRKSWIGWWDILPKPRDNLGCELHAMSQQQASLELLTVAVYGCFYGQFGWWRFNKVLIQGAWPWLNGYNKAFAKAAYAILVALFAAVETGKVDNRGVGQLMLRVANALVAREGGGPSSFLVRQNNRLKATKTKVYGAYVSKEPVPQESVEIEESPEEKVEAKKGPPKGWKCLTIANVEPEKQGIPLPTSNFIIPGGDCNHGENVPFSGRVSVAHSLDELEAQISERNIIVIAQTLGDHGARAEILNYVAEKRILTVLRAEKQCIYCAYRLAHATCALVVVG